MRLSSATGINLVLATGIAMLLAIGVAYHLSVAGQVDQANAETKSQRILAKLEEIFADTKAAESATLGYLINRSARDMERLRRAEAINQVELSHLAESVAGNAEQGRRATALGAAVKTLNGLQQQAARLRQQQGLAAAVSFMSGEAYHKAVEEIERLVDAMQLQERALLAERRDRMNERIRLLTQLAIWGGLMAIALVIFAAVVINVQREERRLAEARLRQQEKQYQLVTDALPAMIGYVDAHHRLRFHNKAYEEWLELPAERLNDRHLSEVLGGETYAAILPKIEQALRGEIVGYERTHVAKDGRQRHLSASFHPNYDSTGRVAGFFAMIVDVTASKRAEEALRNSESLLAETQRVAHIGSWASDFTARKVTWSKQVYEIHGMAADTEIGLHSYVHCIHPEDRERAELEFINQLKSGSAHWVQEYRIQRPDGAVRNLYVEGVLTRASDGRALRAIGVIHDITERKQADDELRRTTERLDLALQGSRLAIWDADIASGSVYLSEGWAEMLGDVAKETFTDGPALFKLAHPDDRERIRTAMVAALKGASPEYHVEHRVRTRSGEWKWMLSHGQVVQRDASGRALRVTGTNADISARKEIERMKNEFISVVSHELRTPLTSIVGSLGLLARMDDLAEQTQTLLRIAQGNAQRLVRLINDILDVEKIDSGLLTIATEPVELEALLHSALQATQGYAEQHGVTLVLASSDAPAWVRANTDRLMQVLANMLSNAAKFSPRSAHVEVRLERVRDTFRVSVTDHGPGVPEDFKLRIFGKFAQADSSSSRPRGGTGLGLAISKSIIEKLGGKMGYVSTFGQGATFYFDLDAHPQAQLKLLEKRAERTAKT
jgi:two-component system sensor histidine kinase/response regulator